MTPEPDLSNRRPLPFILFAAICASAVIWSFWPRKAPVELETKRTHGQNVVTLNVTSELSAK